jgi:hypothetical protein
MLDDPIFTLVLAIVGTFAFGEFILPILFAVFDVALDIAQGKTLKDVVEKIVKRK